MKICECDIGKFCANCYNVTRHVMYIKSHHIPLCKHCQETLSYMLDDILKPDKE